MGRPHVPQGKSAVVLYRPHELTVHPSGLRSAGHLFDDFEALVGTTSTDLLALALLAALALLPALVGASPDLPDLVEAELP